MPEHGIYVSQQATSVSTPVVADSGVPFVVGLAPVQSAESPVQAGKPVLCTSWAEAVEKLGYSDDWKTYTLCEMMYSCLLYTSTIACVSWPETEQSLHASWTVWPCPEAL